MKIVRIKTDSKISDSESFLFQNFLNEKSHSPVHGIGSGLHLQLMLETTWWPEEGIWLVLLTGLQERKKQKKNEKC